MKIEYRSFTASPQSPASELLAAYSSLANGEEKPHLLGYTPVARMNPYQALLYRHFGGHGIAVAPILKPEKFRGLLDFRRMASTTSLHLHWNSWMTLGAAEEERARTVGIGMAARLEQLRDNGVNVIWTVHNVYPHDAVHVDVELEIQQRIADAANIVHVMSASTVDAMDGYVKLDREKILVAPHPSYKGAYVDVITREEARAMLGLGPDEVVFLLFGALKSYKGLDRLLDAVDIMAAASPEFRFRVLVAGSADDSSAVREFINRALVNSSILIESNKIPNDRAQYFLRAADVGLVNYERTLNSGAALLYGTFDLPVVAADTPTFREGLDAGSTVFVEDDSADAFARAMVASVGLIGNESVKRSLATHMERLAPAVVSSEFARNLLTRIQ
ncbi:glycosyltransferase [Arthrobacter sp. ok362]|uniref:glycosyltransferase n=1 Tax=Arthrobacter sp. ok362 TaxID=1761745 RepID=UPI000A67643E|nr:glycosyltransferase [Arthrobacter sp. ok362]